MLRDPAATPHRAVADPVRPIPSTLPAPTLTPPAHPVVVIGASSGGVHAILDLAAQLPGDLEASVLIVLHIDSYDSNMPLLTSRRAALPAAYARDGEAIAPGHIYFAPPDRHLILEGPTLRLTQAAKENHARPAIDPLFRSAALTWDGPVIGVILTGMLDDGASGLRILKQCGGVAVVQDPADCAAPSMPKAALAATKVDHCVPLTAMGPLLVSLVRNAMPKRPDARPVSADSELSLSLGRGNAMEVLARIGQLTPFTCPECGGTLWELDEPIPRRFRCHTGHAYTLRTLEHAHSESASEALWATLRTLSEKQALLREIAKTSGEGREAAGKAARDLGASVERATAALRALIDALPGSIATVVPDEPIGDGKP